MEVSLLLEVIGLKHIRLKKIIIWSVIIIAIVFLFNQYKNGDLSFTHKKVNSIGDAKEEIIESCLDFDTTIKLYSSDLLHTINIHDVINEVKNRDAIIGSCIYQYSIVTEMDNGKFYTTVRIKYYLSKRQMNKVLDMSKDIANSLKNYSDYEKIKYTHDYLIDNANYYVNSDGPYRCLYKGKSNCNGYAIAFMCIMKYCNIPCTYETGDNHAWNSVKLGDYWYNIDVTWDDSGVWDKQGGLQYDFFLKNNSDFKKHHHGSSDAPSSYASNLEIVEDLPNFRLIYNIKKYSILIILISISLTFRYIIKKKNKKKNNMYLQQSANKKPLIEATYKYVTDDDIICHK